MISDLFHTLRKKPLRDDINELKKLKNIHRVALVRNILTSIIMLGEDYRVKEIANFLLQSNVNIYTYIKSWNTLGMKMLEDHRGNPPSNCKVTAEIEDDLLKTVMHTTPNEFGLLGHVWTVQLLADYPYQNCEIRLCPQTIRNSLHKNKFSFKKAQKKPTKGVKSQQEAFKKMMELAHTVENHSESVLYVMDETGLRTELDNRRV